VAMGLAVPAGFPLMASTWITARVEA
jgi:hypothetical protein